jgi:hypothetical protein
VTKEVEFRVRVQIEVETETHIKTEENLYTCKRDIEWLGLPNTLAAGEELARYNVLINGRKFPPPSFSIDLETKTFVFDLVTKYPSRNSSKLPFDPEGWELVKTRPISERAKKKPLAPKRRPIYDDEDEDY